MDTGIQNYRERKVQSRKRQRHTAVFFLWKIPYQESGNCAILYPIYEDRKEYGGKTMRIEQVPAYELVLTQDIPDIHSKGYLLKHKKSGARVMLLENDDDNKVFNIAFRTPPARCV